MYCPQCGTVLPDNAVFCSACGHATNFAAAPAFTPAVQTQFAYAGFWLRLVAYIIDAIILGFIFGAFVVLPLMHGSIYVNGNSFPEIMRQMGPQLGRARFISVLGAWLYYALFESSAWQATLGKKALGLEVTDLHGKRISFGRATGRYFGKIISAMILMIGFIMIGFTEKKQGLHDIMARCLVLKKV